MSSVKLPALAKLWFLAVTPIVAIDAMFVLFRSSDPKQPHPLAETIPFKYWTIYEKYDLRYAPNDDAFVVAQSWMNVIEVVLGMVAVVLSQMNVHEAAVKLALIVAVMTMYKTVLYYLMDVAEDGKFTSHNTFKDKVLMVWVPSSFWIIVPAIIVAQCSRVLRLTSPQPKVSRNAKKK